MYTVYGLGATRAFRVIWMMEELGQSYELVQCAPGSAEARAVNPSGKVPFLDVEGEIIADGTAIMTFLADRHGQLTHAAGTLERARQDSFTHLILDEFDAVLWAAARHSFVLPEERRVPEVKASLQWEFARNSKRLAGRMGDEWLTGETFTVADLLLAHCLNWAKAAKFEIVEPKLLEFHARAKARPAYKAALGRL